jgi:hypothetical protein
MIEIGSCRAILNKISTTVDGGFRLTLDVLPHDEQLLSKLMQRYARDEKVLEIGIVAIDKKELE